MTTTASLPVARREQVREGRTPRDERYVSLSTVRLLATDVYVVAVIDGTGRLTDPASLLTTPLLANARKYANALFESWGGGVPEAPPAAFLERKYQRSRDFPDQRRTYRHIGTIVELHGPEELPTGKWVVRWYVRESTRNHPHRRNFPDGGEGTCLPRRADRTEEGLMSKQKPRAWVRISHRTKDLHPSKQEWEVLWTDPSHDFKKRTKGGFTTKRSAQEWAEQFLSDTRIGEWSDPSKVTPTFSAVAQQWVDERTFERALTEYGYRKLIDGNNELTRTFNDVEVSDITPAMVRQYVSRAAGKLSGQSVRKQFYILRWVLDQAAQDQFIRVNPARAIHRLNLPKQTTDLPTSAWPTGRSTAPG